MQTGFHFEEGTGLFVIDMRDMPVILILLAAAVALEVFLARKEDWRLGLALPGVWLVWMAARLVVRVIQVVVAIQQVGAPHLANPWQALAVAFAVENIPTLLVLAVYGLCRLTRRRRLARQINKTRIDDL